MNTPLSAAAIGPSRGSAAYTAAEARVQTVFQHDSTGMLLNAYGWLEDGTDRPPQRNRQLSSSRVASVCQSSAAPLRKSRDREILGSSWPSRSSHHGQGSQGAAVPS